MIVDILAAIENQEHLEIIKEHTNNGEVFYELHVVPKSAIINIAAQNNIEDPNDAIDFILYHSIASVDDEGETVMDKIRSAKARVSDKANENSRKEKRLTNLTAAGVHERYHPMEGLDPIEVIRAAANVTVENIQLAKDRFRERNNERVSGNPGTSREQRSAEGGRPQPRRAHISLGTTD